MDSEVADAFCPLCETVTDAEEVFVDQDAVMVRCTECAYVYGVVRARYTRE